MSDAITNRQAVEHLASMARHVFWWKPAEVTLSDDAVFLCRAMVLGTWDDLCFFWIGMTKRPFAKFCGRRLRAFSAIARGIIGITVCNCFPFRNCPGA